MAQARKDAVAGSDWIAGVAQPGQRQHIGPVYSIKSQLRKFDKPEDAQEIVDAIVATPHVKTVELTGNTFHQDACKPIADAIEENPDIEVFLMDDCFTSRLKTMIHPSLGYFANALLSAKHLTVLDFSDNAVNPQGAIEISPLLSQCITLRELYLNNTGVGPAGGKTVGECLLQACNLAKSRNVPYALERFVLGRSRMEYDGAVAFAAAAKAIGTLKEVRMYQNGIKPDGCQVLAEGLAHNPHLEVLDLSDNTLKLQGAVGIVKTLKSCTKLKKLSLNDTLLRNRGGLLIAKALRQVSTQMTQLQLLDLSGNDFTPGVADELLPALQNMSALAVLNLQDNGFGEDTMGVYEQALMVKRKGVTLDISGNEDEEDADECDEDEQDCAFLADHPDTMSTALLQQPCQPPPPPPPTKPSPSGAASSSPAPLGAHSPKALFSSGAKSSGLLFGSGVSAGSPAPTFLLPASGAGAAPKMSFGSSTTTSAPAKASPLLETQSDFKTQPMFGTPSSSTAASFAPESTAAATSLFSFSTPLFGAPSAKTATPPSAPPASVGTFSFANMSLHEPATSAAAPQTQSGAGTYSAQAAGVPANTFTVASTPAAPPASTFTAASAPAAPPASTFTAANGPEDTGRHRASPPAAPADADTAGSGSTDASPTDTVAALTRMLDYPLEETNVQCIFHLAKLASEKRGGIAEDALRHGFTSSTQKHVLLNSILVALHVIKGEPTTSSSIETCTTDDIAAVWELLQLAIIKGLVSGAGQKCLKFVAADVSMEERGCFRHGPYAAPSDAPPSRLNTLRMATLAMLS
eukprot:m.36564 g.36564  ORF g.36564 m.36564 type:complete len:806 (+) comp14507_c1_seq1:125-2542(+)